MEDKGKINDARFFKHLELWYHHKEKGAILQVWIDSS